MHIYTFCYYTLGNLYARPFSSSSSKFYNRTWHFVIFFLLSSLFLSLHLFRFVCLAYVQFGLPIFIESLFSFAFSSIFGHVLNLMLCLFTMQCIEFLNCVSGTQNSLSFHVFAKQIESQQLFMSKPFFFFLFTQSDGKQKKMAEEIL